MRVASTLQLGTLLGAFMLSLAAPAFAQNKVTGNVVLDGKTVALKYAYVDDEGAADPVIVLSDQPLPAEAIPFIPEKLVKDKRIHAIAFTISRKDKKLTDDYGMLRGPAHETGVGYGRVADGNVKLTITRMDDAVIEGTFATTKPMALSSVSYSFNATFSVARAKKK
jgi:hypothetical protein